MIIMSKKEGLATKNYTADFCSKISGPFPAQGSFPDTEQARKRRDCYRHVCSVLGLKTTPDEGIGSEQKLPWDKPFNLTSGQQNLLDNAIKANDPLILTVCPPK